MFCEKCCKQVLKSDNAKKDLGGLKKFVFDVRDKCFRKALERRFAKRLGTVESRK